MKVTVQRGQHCKWQFIAGRPRALLYSGLSVFPVCYPTYMPAISNAFLVTFEPVEWEAPLVEVRPEEEIKCGYFPMSGDYLIKEDGCFTMCFKNVEEEPLRLRCKLDAHVMTRDFIDRYLPNYEEEQGPTVEPLPNTPRSRTLAVMDRVRSRSKLLFDGFLREEGLSSTYIPFDISMLCQTYFDVTLYALPIVNLPSGSRLQKIATKVLENLYDSDLYDT